MESGLKASQRRIACISAASCIWEKQLLKVETKELLFSLEMLHYRKFKNDEWSEIIKFLIKQISQDLLPPVLYRQLLGAVTHMGLRIYTWFCKLKRWMFFGKTPDKAVFENYTKKIYWTHDGTIDEVKMFKTFRLNNPDFDVVQMYKMACSYCLEEEVEYFWGQILSRNLIDSLGQCSGYRYDYFYKIDKLILKYWADTRNPSDSFHLELSKLDYGDKISGSTDESVEENMLKLCAKQGNHIGFRYFWYRLNEEKRKAQGVLSLVLMLKVIDRKYGYDIRDYLPVYVKENYHEMSVFLLQNLPEIEKKKFMLALSHEYFHKLILAFMDSWPWQELSVTALSCLLPYRNEQYFFDKIYSCLEDTLKREVEFGLPVDCSELGKQFRQLWHLTPCKFKISPAKTILHDHFTDRCTVWDLPTVKFIVNDKDFNEHKREILNDSHEIFLKLIKAEEIRKLEQFFCEVLVQGDLKESDQNASKTIYKLLLQNDFSSVDKFLNRNIPEDRATVLKEGYTIDFVCYYCIETDQFDLADRILLWINESKDKVKEYKEGFRHNKFTMKHIFDIWKTSKINGDLAVSRCDNFLNWFTNFSEDGIRQFKIEKFTEQTVVDSFDVREMDHGLRDKFLSWCLPWSDEKIQEINEILTCVVQKRSRTNDFYRLKIFKNF